MTLSSESKPQLAYLEKLVAAIDPRDWQPGPQGGFVHLLEIPDLDMAIKHLSTQHPLEYLAVIRGLCGPALTTFFTTTEALVPLDCGLPVSFAVRPINASFAATTPSQATLVNRDLLQGLGYTFFRHSRTEYVDVTLDFRHRDRLDEITWSGSQRLPSVATLHLPLGSGHLSFSNSGTTFFDVRPSKFSLQEILAWLRSVRDHEVALLPELCLPCPDALATSLAADPSKYPPLVVAGSAHVRRDEAAGPIRANECHVYLDGQLVSIHRKIHPLKTKKLGDHRFDAQISEAITEEPKQLLVLSGGHTRLGIAICADLNEPSVPALLEAAGVNLLLVPALTYSSGAFNGAVCTLASRCQAVCVIVNADLESVADRNGHTSRPFLVFASVPRPEPLEQSSAYRPPSDRPLPHGVFNPNLELPLAMDWP